MSADKYPSIFSRQMAAIVYLSCNNDNQLTHLADKMTRRLFVGWNIKKVLLYLEFLKKESPRHRSRYSQQAWLRRDQTAHPVIKQLYERYITVQLNS